MQSMLLKNITRQFLFILVIHCCFGISLLYAAAPASDKKINMSNRLPSQTNNYNWIRVTPVNDINSPACDNSTSGMIAVDLSGAIFVCGGTSGWVNNSDPWEQSGRLVYPKNSNYPVAIGGIPAVDLAPEIKLSVAKYIDPPAPATRFTNKMDFRPSDGADGNAGITITNNGTPNGENSSRIYVDFLVGEGSRGVRPWDARISYDWPNVLTYWRGLSFYAQRRTGGSWTLGPQWYPDLKLYSDGNVDFGVNTTNTQNVSRNSTQKVKVNGNTKAEKLIISNGVNTGEFKVNYHDGSLGPAGYYAVYGP